MGQRTVTGVEYLYSDDVGTWLNDYPEEPANYSGIVRATVTFHRWHSVDISFRVSPGTTPECIGFAFHVSPDGPSKLTPADLRQISLPDLLNRANPVATTTPARARVDGDRLQRVADIYAHHAGGEAITEIRTQLHVSRSRAYALVSQAREAGLLTEESTT